jgi:hypothetical protein
MRIPVPNTLAFAALVMAALGGGTELRASIVPVYSNFPVAPAGGYQLDQSQPYYLGASFSPSQAATLDHVVVPLFFQQTDPQVSLQVFLYGSDGGMPGSPLANLGTIMVDSNHPAANNLYTTPSSASEGLTLNPAKTYWLVLENLSPPNSGITWALNGSGANGFVTSNDGSAWDQGNPGNGFNTSPAFEIYGESVPEAGTLLTGLFLIPFALQGLRCLRNRGEA